MPNTPGFPGVFLVCYTRGMVKTKKKRTKKYHGEDAATPQSGQPVIHRVVAVDRGKVGQWWFEKKRTVKIASITTGAIVFIGWLIVELFRAIF